MNDSPHLGGPLLREEGEHLLVGVPVVDDDGEIPFPGEADLLAEGGALGIPRGPVPEEIEPRLPDGDHLVAPREEVETRKKFLRTGRGVVRVEPHGGVDSAVAMGDLDRLLVAFRVDPDREDAGHPRLACTADDVILRIAERFQVQMGMRVEEHRASVPGTFPARETFPAVIVSPLGSVLPPPPRSWGRRSRSGGAWCRRATPPSGPTRRGSPSPPCRRLRAPPTSAARPWG